ncbi:MAG: aldo/keto reductase [Armatimonadetes bacterium CG07_land_8_20_14_0_80_59_28]|nr:MAG: aldo/keto reductase [Armatimonadetes bacterium CG07_land_8_20_14_0_80_59_28]PIX43622.1 MAG: aldo/keto reductase [Armatimonadetes bacterium CG_4_8_14_3_um_filter_58_9]
MEVADRGVTLFRWEGLNAMAAMQYRALGKTGLKVSALAMGCMRLPENDSDLAAAVVDAAVEAGINYFETTRGYINGKCQHLVAPGLKGRSRGLIVSGKAGVNEETTADSYRQEIDLQMQILGVDYLEFFQVGWFSLEKLPLLTKDDGALTALDKARSEGIISHIGFTGHDQPENVVKLVETGIFDSVTLAYNMVNRSYAPAIRRAAELGVGVVVMCPVAGGMLAAPAPQLQELIPGGSQTTAAAALQFVLANLGVSCACSGMNTLQMVEENVATVASFSGMHDEDWLRMNGVLDQFATVGDRFCTACGYCMDCPEGVDIPGIFRLYNYAKVYGLEDWARLQYQRMDPAKRAEACVKCGTCEPNCPHKISIMDQLEEVAEALGVSAGTQSRDSE